MKYFAAIAVALTLATSAAVAHATPDEAPTPGAMLRDLGFSLNDLASDRPSISTPRRGVLVPTPWGEVEATIVSTPVDRMLRVPLTSGGDTRQDWSFQPYVTAGSRKDVDADPALEQVKPSSFADGGRTNLKAGAGISLKLDENIEIFGEYQFMRLNRSQGGLAGPLGTSLDAGGFSLGLSVRY